jgi:hypothetical protein
MNEAYALSVKQERERRRENLDSLKLDANSMQISAATCARKQRQLQFVSALEASNSISIVYDLSF